MATAIVGSRLEYCNSLLAGTSVSNLSRLQLVQNTLTRVLAQHFRFDHITPVLSELHWLPVRHRINFKIAAITHTVLQSQQPSNLMYRELNMLLHQHVTFFGQFIFENLVTTLTQNIL